MSGEQEITVGTATAGAPGLPAADKPAITPPAGGTQADTERAFSQADVDRIVSDRLSRQKTQFADYDDLKAKASKWDKHEETLKSEAQKAQERLAALERERDAALAKAQDTLIRSLFVAEAAKAQAVHPEDVYALADLSGVTVDEKGNIRGVVEAVRAVIDAGRIPLVAQAVAPDKVKPPRLDGGAGAASRSGDKETAPTDEEILMAQRLHVPIEKYMAQRKAIKAGRQ